MPKKYDQEFKDRAVRMVVDHRDDYGSLTKATIAVGSQLNIPRETLRRWVSQARVDAGDRPGVSTQENEEIRALKRENKRLRDANEILRSAAVFFAGELDPRNR
ncbi:transposase [Georgenia sp. M64]|uniref:transposase n=1 Tax=Georgenia sp. M64 TaxID=3120520 RepID=UPI0030E30250